MVQWSCQLKSVCKADRHLESLPAGKVPGRPDRKRMLSDQAFHIRHFFCAMQPQKVAAGLEGNRKINLVDMLPLLLFKCDLPCYVRAEIKKYESRPYLMGDHLPAF